MASKTAVIKALAVLAANFSGAVEPEKIVVWGEALAGVPDDALKAAVGHVVKTHRGEFIPPVAVVLAACGDATAAPDVEAVIRAIDKAGSYNPNTGWSHPRVDKVRELFGPAVAEAYGAVGGSSRLFAANETTREIAARDFGKALADERTAPEVRRLERPDFKQLAAGERE